MVFYLLGDFPRKSGVIVFLALILLFDLFLVLVIILLLEHVCWKDEIWAEISVITFWIFLNNLFIYIYLYIFDR